MRKLLLICGMAFCGLGSAFAQEVHENSEAPSQQAEGTTTKHKRLELEDYKYFNHISVGLSLGLDGIGFDVAAPITDHFAVRTGGTFMPKISYDTHIVLDGSNAFLDDKTRVDIEGKLHMNNFHFLFDYYPSKKSSFHLTAGAYIGKKACVKAYNLGHFLKPSYYGTAGLELGDGKDIYDQYSIISDENGNVQLDMVVNAFKPYVGFGFGRAIPKRRVNVTFDMGVQFWGKPGIEANVKYFDFEEGNYVTGRQKLDRGRITATTGGYEDLSEAIRIMEKIRVYPVLKLTINGRIF